MIKIEVQMSEGADTEGWHTNESLSGEDSTTDEGGSGWTRLEYRLLRQWMEKIGVQMSE